MIHPDLAPFYEGVWTARQEDVPLAGLHVPHFRDRLRRELSTAEGRIVDWNDVFEIVVANVGFSRAQVETPIPEYTYAFWLLSAAWLVRRYPDAGKNKIVSLAQALGEIASEESCYSPPVDEDVYDQAMTVANRFKRPATTAAETDHLIDSILAACMR